MIERLRLANLALTAFGAGVFAALFIYVATAPEDFNERTRQFAISTVQSRTESAIRDLAHSDQAESVAEFAGIFSDRLENEIRAAQASMDAGIPQMIADVLTAACKLDCEKKEAAEEAVRLFFQATISRYEAALSRLQALIVGEYDRVMGELRADILIFAGSTLLAFLGALALALFKGRAAAHLLPISLALSLATIIAMAWYIFGQDWVMAIIFSDYWGWAYSVIIAAIWALLADIAANKARVTTFLLNGIGDIFGSFNLSPC